MNYFIDPHYTHREKPEYAVDNFSRVTFQPKVYELAHGLMTYLSTINTLVDVGCGSGDKLGPFFRSGFNVIPIDYGHNVELFQQRHGFKPLVFDLESEHGLDITVKGGLKSNSSGALVVCADVIEHMINPENLLRGIKRMMLANDIALLLISTPDREKLGNMAGPPFNPAHVREWTLSEFKSFVQQYFKVLNIGYTTTVVNLDGSELKATIQVLATI